MCYIYVPGSDDSYVFHMKPDLVGQMPILKKNAI
jgi:hypothetical protein